MSLANNEEKCRVQPSGCSSKLRAKTLNGILC